MHVSLCVSVCMLTFCLECLRSFLAPVSTEKICEYKNMIARQCFSHNYERQRAKESYNHISVSHSILIDSVSMPSLHNVFVF